MSYWLRLARPGWIIGTAIAAVALAMLQARVGLADDIPGSITTARLVAAVLSIGVAAAFLDTTAAVLDATPYPRSRRRLTPPALTLAALLAVGAALAAAHAARVPGVPWPALTFESIGLVTLAAATGATCRGSVDPGLIAPIAGIGLITLDARAPWEPVLTAPPGPDWARAHLAWAALIIIGLAIGATRLRDPARKGRW
jgi:hypothetical protein